MRSEGLIRPSIDFTTTLLDLTSGDTIEIVAVKGAGSVTFGNTALDYIQMRASV